jgi:hypothetical protein
MYDLDWEIELHLAKSEAMGVMISNIIPSEKFKSLLHVSTEDDIWEALSKPNENDVKI